MAEDKNLSLIRTIYSAFNTGDIQAVFDKVSANAQWVNYGPEAVPYAGDLPAASKNSFGPSASRQPTGK